MRHQGYTHNEQGTPIVLVRFGEKELFVARSCAFRQQEQRGCVPRPACPVDSTGGRVEGKLGVRDVLVTAEYRTCTAQIR